MGDILLSRDTVDEECRPDFGEITFNFFELGCLQQSPQKRL